MCTGTADSSAVPVFCTKAVRKKTGISYEMPVCALWDLLFHDITDFAAVYTGICGNGVIAYVVVRPGAVGILHHHQEVFGFAIGIAVRGFALCPGQIADGFTVEPNNIPGFAEAADPDEPTS